MTRPVAIVNARIFDPVAGTQTRGGVLVANRRLVAVGDIQVPQGAQRFDARGGIIAPGLIDLGVFAIDFPAFAAGGITRVALMPDQSPPLDDPALVARAAAAGKPDVWVHPLAAATRGLEGRELGEIGLLQRAGAVAVATGRRWIADSGVMLRLLSYARAFDLTVITHAEDGGLTDGAVATASETSTRLGLPAAPAAAEAMAVARDIGLVAETGARLHFRQLTTAAAFALVRDAKARGLPVSCGISPAHLLLSETAIGDFRTFARLSPPLRTERDRLAAIEAVRDGTVDVLTSSHDPLGPDAKRLPFEDAGAGAAGAETLLTLALTLVRDEIITLMRLFEMTCATPARLLGLPVMQLQSGGDADIILIDPDTPWRIDADRMAARAGNTPFDGLPVQGRVRLTVKGGDIVGGTDAG
jgi:dihydroorotase